jgi:hypothetical protein
VDPTFTSLIFDKEQIMNFQQLLLDATEAVLAWEIPEEDYAEAIKNQACLMAGISLDELQSFDLD